MPKLETWDSTIFVLFYIRNAVSLALDNRLNALNLCVFNLFHLGPVFDCEFKHKIKLISS